MSSKALRERLFLRWEQEAAELAPLVAATAGEPEDSVAAAIVARSLAWTHRMVVKTAVKGILADEECHALAADLRVQARRAYDVLEHGPAGYGSWMADPDVRVSDLEREAVADTLREHAAEGRLEPEELEQRLGVAYAARTRRDLEGLTTDLPQRAAAPPAPPSVARRLMPLTLRLAIADLFCVGIWFLSGMHGTFWPGWVILVSVLAVANRALHVAGRDARRANAGQTSPPARDRGRRRDRDRRR